ncbi:YdcA family protein [Rhizobium leguminosarum]
MRWTSLIALLVAIFAIQPVMANTPCSGRKGGIDHCQGSTFICRDGSVSASKKSCEATMGAVGLLGPGVEEMQPNLSGDCSCRGGNYCTGPRGGRYCTTDTGAKSYLRQ